MNAVIYGAGNIGRGFIGALFAGSGYNVTFIDTAEEIVKGLREKRSYPVRLLSDKRFEDVLVEGVNAVHGANEAEAAELIAQADIMATAVGVRALPFIAPVIAAGLKKRFKQGASPLNIIICENLIDADRYLAGLIRNYLDTSEAGMLEKNVGFVEASIGRMVPVQLPEMQDGNILRICSEEYSFLPVDKNAFVGEIPEIKGMIPFDQFGFFIQRKLFIHNMGHAVCAYLGLLLGDTYISAAISRADVYLITENAMLESALALEGKFGVQLKDLVAHIKDLLFRFNNRALKDSCARVGADIERKLGPSDRLIGAMRGCAEQGITPSFISIGAAAAIFCLLRERGLDQKEENAAPALMDISGLEAGSAELPLILEMYGHIRQGKELNALISLALEMGKKTGVI